jgi:DNA-binding NarL/FixJ family response regulator
MSNILVRQQHEYGTCMRADRNFIELTVRGWSSESISLGLRVVESAIKEHKLHISGKLHSDQALV